MPLDLSPFRRRDGKRGIQSSELDGLFQLGTQQKFNGLFKWLFLGLKNRITPRFDIQRIRPFNILWVPYKEGDDVSS